MRILKAIGLTVLGMILVLGVAVGGLFIATNGDYPLPATVTEDDTLPSVTLDGVTFHAETYGAPENPVALVLHGGPGGDYRYLLPLQELSDEYYVVFYDQRGTGLSERVPREQLTLQTMIDDVDRMAQHYGGGEPVIIIGHSWGAMLGAAYTEQHPEMVARLVLAEPGALTTEHMTLFLERQQEIIGPAFIWKAVITGFEAAHISDPVQSSDYLNGTMAHYWATHPDNPYNCPGSTYESTYWRWGGFAFTDVIANATDDNGVVQLNFYTGEQSVYTEPVLFIASACNDWLGEDLQRDHMTLYENADLVVIPDSGHEMFGEQPEASIGAVRAYLE
jgi:proline iminopeptidase